MRIILILLTVFCASCASLMGSVDQSFVRPPDEVQKIWRMSLRKLSFESLKEGYATVLAKHGLFLVSDLDEKETWAVGNGQIYEIDRVLFEQERSCFADEITKKSESCKKEVNRLRYKAHRVVDRFISELVQNKQAVAEVIGQFESDRKSAERQLKSLPFERGRFFEEVLAVGNDDPGVAPFRDPYLSFFYSRNLELKYDFGGHKLVWIRSADRGPARAETRKYRMQLNLKENPIDAELFETPGKNGNQYFVRYRAGKAGKTQTKPIASKEYQNLTGQMNVMIWRSRENRFAMVKNCKGKYANIRGPLKGDRVQICAQDKGSIYAMRPFVRNLFKVLD